ncbi:hypothetical protein BHU72_08560 [Desulfuribacillus stibiiarsenatis]|uniref:Diguanylate cyclase n=1 Tax=Desulfuribacillus stibiiarsenatis TaxID=1390249 RepID=A0A1E5L398_9FIRM|nr:bifunctional diguanylate cyclase/phosphodiesterase [Desulfuribacillus stibiiarsenatis]OEH84551.1 hypothetical protein BHU72_08560 [Desulfuribacillus stibiiarsenatis]
MRSLKGFLLYGAIIGTVIMSLLVFTGVSFGYGAYVKKQTIERAEKTAEITFNSLYVLMKKGWDKEQITSFLEANEESYKANHITVDFYSRDMQFNGKVKDVFADGIPKQKLENNIITYYYPKTIEQDCLVCHIDNQVGDVLGVLQLSEDIQPIIDEAKQDTLLYLLFLFPLPVLGAYILSRFLVGRLEKSISVLHNKIENVNKTDDLQLFEDTNIDLTFSEINVIYDELKALSKRIRSISVDKDILEFEVKLLEKFIITSEVVKDWKEHVNVLLIEINKIMDVHLIFSLFKVEDEDYVLEVFWLLEPNEETKASFEQMIKEKIGQTNAHKDVEMFALEIYHNVADPTSGFDDLDDDNINFQTKSLFLETPRIGGIVGIGVNSNLSSDATRSLVVESILTTLLNVIGSVKAVYKYTKELEYFATRDPLTNLYTQRVYWEMLNYEVLRANRHGYKFGVIVIDLDDFKLINDLHGHLFGDKFLQQVAQVIKGSLREGDILARYGGDEYAIVLPFADVEQVHFVGTRIMDELKKFTLEAPNGATVRVSASIGAAVYPDHAEDSKNLFLIADNMMYKAKGRGKDQIGLPSSDDVIEIFKTIEDKNTLILKALEENRVIPFFQPIKRTSDGQILANEVLMRIDLPEQIMVASDFVEIAESMGIISKLDYMLIEKALHKANAENYTGLLFLNLSPKALIVSDFLKNVRKLVKQYKIPHSQIVFEITERDTVKNLTVLSKFVLELKREGFKFAIDDFGSGFSSYQYIKRLPIDYIKIEGEFIRSLTTDDETDRAIVLSIVTLARELGIVTIGEFVEDEETYQYIKEIGITYAQGYHIGRPSPNLHLDKVR